MGSPNVNMADYGGFGNANLKRKRTGSRTGTIGKTAGRGEGGDLELKRRCPAGMQSYLPAASLTRFFFFSHWSGSGTNSQELGAPFRNELGVREILAQRSF